MNDLLSTEEQQDLVKLHEEVSPNVPFEEFAELFFETDDWEGFLELLSEASFTSVTSKYGLSTANKLKKMKKQYSGNTNVTVSVDPKTGKVIRKKKDKALARKMARVLAKNRKKGKSKRKRTLAKTKRSSAYKKTNEEINMEDVTKYDSSDDISALFDGEDLSDEFKSKASAILEAAVTSNVKKAVEALAEEKEEVQEETQEKESDIEQIDSYLNYVVEEWMSENQLAVDTNIRTGLTEQFIDGLKELFKESYIDIPEDKVDVVSELTEQIETLTAELNEERSFTIEMKEVIDCLRQESIVEDCVSDMVETDAEKIRELSEGIEFTSDEDYREKVELLKECGVIISKNPSVMGETVKSALNSKN